METARSKKKSPRYTTSLTSFSDVFLEKATCTPSSKQRKVAVIQKAWTKSTDCKACLSFSLSLYICGIYQLSLLPLKINIPQQSVVGRSPRSPPPSLSTTSLLSYDHCYVCAVEHKVALLVPSAVPSHHSDLSAGSKALLLACLRKTDSPLYATTSKD